MQQLVDLKRLADEIPRPALDRSTASFTVPNPVTTIDDVRIAGRPPPRSPRTSIPGSRRSVTMMSKAKSASRARAASPDSASLDLIAAVAELLRNGPAERCFVLDEQEMFQRVRHLATSPRF
jgi:hypothetical protein